ncbi:MAG: glycosyltransferase family protein [Hyphomicrobiales bacterium]
MTGRVLFYVQHLLGIGHVVRAARIARALSEAGFAVKVAFGGPPVGSISWGGAELAHLPALTSGPEGFGSLVDETGAVASARFKEERRDELLAMFTEVAPEIVLIEAYPFARRIMRFELLPLIERAREVVPRPLIVSSIRDILQEGRKHERLEETADIIETSFDAVLVHGDERFAPLNASFPLTGRIASKLHYTGVIALERNLEKADERFDVIVSAGGGAVGGALLKTAAHAMTLTSLSDKRWLFLAGPNLDATSFDAVAASLPENAKIERFRADLPALLANAGLSISQAGYNTVADILCARCASVLVPFSTGGETEQTVRAKLLAEKGVAAWVSEDDLTPDTLARAIAQATRIDFSNASRLPDVKGAFQTAEILRKLLAGQKAEMR